MRALTVCQPYAHLIVLEKKPVENREWSTRYRGPLVIHAGKSLAWMAGEKPSPDMAFGAAVGMADLVDCLHINEIEDGLHDARYPWIRDHEHTQGTFCLVLENVHRFAIPIPCKGAQGFWNFPETSLPAGLRSRY